jgi:hydroxypyruvate reductase
MTVPSRSRRAEQLPDDALAIWTAGVRAVDGQRLVSQQLQVDGHWLGLPDHDLWIDTRGMRRIVVAGAGKAAAAMASGAAEVLRALPPGIERIGHVQIPATFELGQPLAGAHGVVDLRQQFLPAPTGDGEPQPARTNWLACHVVRPVGVNLATDLAVQRTQELCQTLAKLGPQDLCLFLLSGGASALLAWPAPGISLEEKNHVTQFLAAAGAPIEDLNGVRSALSRVKAGGLARHCPDTRVLTLIVSDVLGDPLPSIGSGPTWADTTSPQKLADRALEILRRYDPAAVHVSRAIYRYLQTRQQADGEPSWQPSAAARDWVVIGNTAAAVDAAGMEAERRGYSHAMHVQRSNQGDAQVVTADDEGRDMAAMLSQMNRQSGPDCLITGGESVVHLAGATAESRGGRNQQFGLAALQYWQASDDRGFAGGQICLVSGGTDGEDGPTPVAGVCLGGNTLHRGQALGLNPAIFSGTKDSYNYFRQTGGLLLTGPTHTNVCDLRVGVVQRVNDVLFDRRSQ